MASGRTRDLKGAEVVFDDTVQNGSQGTEVQLLEGFKQHSFGRGTLCTVSERAHRICICQSALHCILPRCAKFYMTKEAIECAAQLAAASLGNHLDSKCLPAYVMLLSFCES